MNNKNVIIVESPSKIKTLQKFLGENYIIEASVGHIRDLPKKNLGLDLDNEFIDNKNLHKYAQELLESDIKSEKIKNSELRKISNNKNPQGIIAICDFMPMKISDVELDQLNWIVLDNISDPGNLGTILRTAEWFGIKNIFISSDSVDLYNEKVLRSGMGAHFYLNNIIF